MQVHSKRDVSKDRKVKYDQELKGENDVRNFRVCANL